MRRTLRRFHSLLFIFACFFLFIPHTLHAKAEVIQKMKGLHMPFIANEGQIDGQVAYYAKTFGGTLFVTKDGKLVYSLPKSGEKEEVAGGWVLREEIVGGSVTGVKGEEQSSTNVSSFIGNDPSTWRKSISTYGLVSLGTVYEGIDLSLKAYGNNVEKIFTVKPGADPKIIRLKLTGAKDISINRDGELEVRTDYGPITFSKPIAFQDIQGTRVDVPVQYALLDQDNTYGFTVAGYDPGYELVIDPLLQATYLGGSGSDSATAIAIDADGNVYVAGTTSSTNFPGTTGGAQATYGSNDAFVAKLNQGLTGILQSTYLGGSGADSANAIALDSSGNVYVAGFTGSLNFPGTDGGAQTSGAVFVAKLESSLMSLIQATHLGTNPRPYRNYLAMAIDTGGNVYVTLDILGNFVGTDGGYQCSYEKGGVFVAKLHSSLTSPIQTTCIGLALDYGPYPPGTCYPSLPTDPIPPIDADAWVSAIAIGAAGNVYLTGTAGGYGFDNYSGKISGFPQLDTNCYPAANVFVLMLEPSLTVLSGYYQGGGNGDFANAIAIDANGNVYVAGWTRSVGTIQGSYAGAQASYGGNEDAFVSGGGKYTYLGGSGSDSATAIAIGAGGNVYVAGRTTSTNFPGTAGGAQMSYGGTFVAKLNSSLSSLQSTYLTGLSGGPTAIAVSTGGNVYVAGNTSATNFLGTAGGAQTSNGGGTDALVVKLDSTLTAATLTVSKTGNGTGTVTSNPAGINCGLDCTEKYSIGIAITLTATPDPGYTFTGWSGGGCSGTGTCQITMTNLEVTVTATFNDITPPSNASITINSGSAYANTSTVTLSLSATDVSNVTEMKISNTDGDWGNVTAEPYAATKTGWLLTEGDGTKTVYARFKDSVGNWSTTSRIDTIIMDTVLPNPAITSPANGAQVSSLYILLGTVTDTGLSSGINRVELQVTDGTNYLMGNGGWSITPTYFTSSGGIVGSEWRHSIFQDVWTIGTTYTITVRAFDNAGNFSETSSTFSMIEPTKGFTTLSVTSSSESILQNGKLDVTGMLSRSGAPDEDLSNKEIILTITYRPDQGNPVVKTVITANTNNDKSGHYLVTGIEKDNQNFIFNQKGIFTIHASFSGDSSLMSSTAESFVVVGQVAGYAIIVEGKILPSEEGLASHNKTANRIYNVLSSLTLKVRGFQIHNANGLEML